jgi:hypothetical protein
VGIIITRSVVAGASEIAKPIIGYHNLLNDVGAVIVGDPTTVVANAYDGLTYDYWTTGAAGGTITLTLPDARGADYFAFFAHTLHYQNGTIKLQYNVGAGWVTITETEVTPGVARPVMKTFDMVYASQWRVVITNDAAVNLGMVAFGERLDMQRGAYVGVTPLHMARSDTILNNTTQNGQFLGRSLIRTGISGSIQFELLTAAWVRLKLDAFILHARTKAFFIAWYPSRYPDEVAVCWTTDTPQPNNSRRRHMSMQLAYEGRAE